jgi:hypothetical protein
MRLGYWRVWRSWWKFPGPKTTCPGCGESLAPKTTNKLISSLVILPIVFAAVAYAWLGQWPLGLPFFVGFLGAGLLFFFFLSFLVPYLSLYDEGSGGRMT